jgi:hypothetical protein
MQVLLFSEENWQLITVVFTVMGQTLSRSYGRCIAEFLNEESLVHLGLLDLSTCVGLRYGQPYTRVSKLFWSPPSQESTSKGLSFVVVTLLRRI